jgi:hypothetical protein
MTDSFLIIGIVVLHKYHLSTDIGTENVILNAMMPILKNNSVT